MKNIRITDLSKPFCSKWAWMTSAVVAYGSMPFIDYYVTKPWLTAVSYFAVAIIGATIIIAIQSFLDRNPHK